MRQAWVWASLASVAWIACGPLEPTRPWNGGPPVPAPAGTGGTLGASGQNGGVPGFSGAFSDNPSRVPVPVGREPGEIPLGCERLQCQQTECESGKTTISGRVYDPAGKNSLYNVAVYIPNSTPMPLPAGASCAPCESLYTGNPVVTALTDSFGDFVIENAPDGENIPLVVQIGKWRRQFVLPRVVPCQDNPLPNRSLTLPKNRREGDMPNIAISTGAADTLECLLRRVGVDASEYASGTDDGRIHIFQGTKGPSGRGGGGTRDAPNTTVPAPPSATGLWQSADELMKYDIVLLSCEGRETQGLNREALHDYASRGGRVFASHFHYAWFNEGPYAEENLANWSVGSNDMGNISAQIVTSFPKGQALWEWLRNNRGLVNGELPIQEARHNADVGEIHTASQAWIVANDKSNPPGATQYFSFNTPTDARIGPDGGDYCGRVVYSDLHVGAASGDDIELDIPDACTDVELSPQEKALEFMLFDLSACVTPDDRKPEPPIVL